MCKPHLYWLGRMLEAGEDRMYMARRLIRMAIEDIGMADPRALEQTIAAKQCVHFPGDPRRRSGLGTSRHLFVAGAQVGRCVSGIERCAVKVRSGIAYPVPMHLRNAPTRAMKEWGYGTGYQHAHEYQDAVPDMECLPEELAIRIFTIRRIAAWSEEYGSG